MGDEESHSPGELYSDKNTPTTQALKGLWCIYSIFGHETHIPFFSFSLWGEMGQI